MNNPDISGLFPMARWIINAKNNEKDITLAARLSIVAAESYLAMGNDLLGPGFHLLPYISSVVDTRKARVYGGLCASGFESIPLKGEQFVSPLSGWALSILKRQADPHARDSLVLIRECFKAREGTLDEDWFLAAAALDMWTSKRDRAYARLEWTIEQRIQELQRLPSLSKEDGSRWDDVMTKMSKLSGSSYGVSLSLVLNQAAVQQVLLGSMEGGWISHSMGTLEQLNTFTHRVGLHNSEWVKKVSSYSWRNGISEQFWERQHFVCPKWVSFASNTHLINDLSMRLERGLRMPEGLDPSRRWPESIATWMEAQELNKKTDISSHVPRPRRM